tara:strand:+ start:164 stop:775 length:612 start_codon:yes stop_codon:yes gene_type:complete
MAKAEELFGDEILFIPDEKKKISINKDDWKRPLTEGEYLGHLKDITTREVSFKGYKATVYNYFFEVAKENGIKSYTFKDEEYSGSEYVGRTIKGSGVFKFLTPKEGDDFEANPSGNDKYLLFCKSIGIPVKQEEREIDGKKIKVEIMPSLSEEDIVGKPAIGVVGRGKPYTNKNGKEIKPWYVKFVKSWDEGEIKDFTEEIPF